MRWKAQTARGLMQGPHRLPGGAAAVCELGLQFISSRLGDLPALDRPGEEALEHLLHLGRVLCLELGADGRLSRLQRID